LIKAAEDLGRILRFRVEVGNQFETVCRLVAAKVGIGVIPASAAHRYARDTPIRIISLEDAWSRRDLHLCVRDAEPLPAFAQELVDLLAADAASATDCASEPCGAAG
jgi:DNA-binding transcriptional LysR family regulator